MPIDCVYFNDYIRCYRDGKVERYWYWLKKPAWRVVPNTANNNVVYNSVNVGDKKIKRHRIIAFCFIGDFNIDNPEEEIDHIDGDCLNNSVDNLRTCSGAGNDQNKHNVKGYIFDKRSGKYRARIMLNGRQFCGKYRLTEEEAHQDYLDLKKIHHTYFQDKEKQQLIL